MLYKVISYIVVYIECKHSDYFLSFMVMYLLINDIILCSLTSTTIRLFKCYKSFFNIIIFK